MTYFVVPGTEVSMLSNNKIQQINTNKTEQIHADFAGVGISVASEASESRKARRRANPHHGRKALALIAALMALLVCTNALLCFLIEPYMGSSEEMWQGFAKIAGGADSFHSDHNVESADIAIPDAANDSGNMSVNSAASGRSSGRNPATTVTSASETAAAGPLDTIIVGTSMGLSGIDPEVLDASLGSRSFNMCTNMQSLSASLAAIQTAQEYAPDGLRRVILVLDHEILMDDGSGNFRADASFWHGKGTVETLPRRLTDGIRFMTSPDYIGEPASLLYPFPWIYNRSLDIARNLSEKRTHTFEDPEGHRTAQGFEPSDEVIDQNIYLVDPDEADAWDEQNPDLIRPFISDDSRRKLTLLAMWCEERSIELDAMIIPFPNWLNIYQKDAYLAVDDELRELFASCGASFSDYNLIPREAIGLTSTDFKDVGHMNTHGAEQFTSYLACDLHDQNE